jgi:anti-anti-sigma factor
MPTSLALETARCNDGKHVLIATGEIDLSNIDDFKEALITATTQAASGGALLTVDLSAVEYLDSAAINVLYARAEHVEQLLAHPLLLTSLTVSGLAELIPTRPAPLPKPKS